MRTRCWAGLEADRQQEGGRCGCRALLLSVDGGPASVRLLWRWSREGRVYCAVSPEVAECRICSQQTPVGVRRGCRHRTLLIWLIVSPRPPTQAVAPAPSLPRLLCQSPCPNNRPWLCSDSFAPESSMAPRGPSMRPPWVSQNLPRGQTQGLATRTLTRIPTPAPARETLSLYERREGCSELWATRVPPSAGLSTPMFVCVVPVCRFPRLALLTVGDCVSSVCDPSPPLWPDEQGELNKHAPRWLSELPCGFGDGALPRHRCPFSPLP